MKKQEEEQQLYELNDFEKHCHLWNIVPGGKGKGIVLLRSIIDSIHSENHLKSHNKLPSILLVGEADNWQHEMETLFDLSFLSFFSQFDVCIMTQIGFDTLLQLSF